MELLSFCPVCSELIEEPVTLPCHHELCLVCFRGSVDAGNLHCPLCRQRISNWARRRAADPVDSTRKKQLDKQYSKFGPIENLRLVAALEREARETRNLTRQSQDGEIRRELEELVLRERTDSTERDRMDEEEAFRLQEEERLAALKDDYQMERDEMLAREMNEQFMKEDVRNISQMESDKKMASELVRIEKKSNLKDKPAVTLMRWFTVLPKEASQK